MNTIKRLSQEIIAKIAAGEVIERPAFAVKELVENAIDAGAKTITIDIEKSGLGKIVVSDDGIGMNKEDVMVCWQQHTTSKIYTPDDLFHITTLGFRGEALSSIASISTCSIQSKTATAESGWIVNIEHGKLIAQQPIGMSIGTKVCVTQLFHNVPARHNFLKSMETEFRTIVQVVTNQALSHPQITFTLTHNKKNIFTSFAHRNYEERVIHLLGLPPEQFIPIKQTRDSYTLEGFITKPQFATTQASKYYLFVNQRSVRSKRIAQTIRDTYGTLLPRTHFPQFILFISLPAESVDANVHPRKEEVQLVNEETIYYLIDKTIAETLSQENLTFYDARWRRNTSSTTIFTSPRFGETDTFASSLLKDTLLPKNEEIMQLHQLYLLEETTDGFLITDQHAAHERVVYEKLMESWKQQKKQTTIFTLRKPLFMILSVSERETLNEFQAVLQNQGFHLTIHHEDTVAITAIPAVFKDRNVEEILRELISELENQSPLKSLDSRTHQMLTYIACRASIKKGQLLNLKERKELLESLAQTPHNATCPHGRPTQVHISKKYLHQLFNR